MSRPANAVRAHWSRSDTSSTDQAADGPPHRLAVNSTQQTFMAGQISAQAGRQGGNGGNVGAATLISQDSAGTIHNSIGALGDFRASAFACDNNQSLTVSGAVTGGPISLALAAESGLNITGSLSVICRAPASPKQIIERDHERERA